MSALLDLRGLIVEYQTARGRLRAVDGLSFSIEPGETLALVGESGCGKSTAALALMRLASSGQASIRSEQMLFEGEDLSVASEERMRDLRGSRIAMVFQDPSMYLNPVHTVGAQIGEVLRVHMAASQAAAQQQAVELLALVGVPAPAERVEQYPHNLSGGLRQRVMIAMALACKPRLLIADEPTTALDVTIQAQVLALIRDLKAGLGMAVLLITHDLGVVAETADRVIVMYAGRKVEEASVRELFTRPVHPYTQGLVRAARWSAQEDGSFFEISGTVPSLIDLPAGCSFAERCTSASPACRLSRPPLVQLGPRRSAECVLAQEAS
jgi:peptide/nickel transport system ATP-binding protein